MKTIDTHDQLQHIEHVNKMMREHKELVTTITTDVNAVMTKYIEGLQVFARHLKDVQVNLSMSVKNIYSSVQEIKRITGTTQDIQAAVIAIEKLDKALNDETVQRILKVIKL